jgi:hypothetical protein
MCVYDFILCVCVRGAWYVCLCECVWCVVGMCVCVRDVSE